MKYAVKFSSGLLFTALLTSTPVSAVSADAVDLHRLEKRTAELEQQIKELTQQLSQTQSEISKAVQASAKTTPTATVASQHSHSPEGQDAAHTLSYTRGAPVTTSPYIGSFSDYEDEALLASLSDIDEDYFLLKQRQRLKARRKEMGSEMPKHALVDLSGIIGAGALVENPYRGHPQTDAFLDSVELDLVAQVASWATGYMSINYDGAPASTTSRRSANSRLFIDKAFLVVGDLDRSPIYASIGQMYVPFGQYSSFMFTSPLTKALGKTSARAISLGAHEQNDYGFFGSLYAFQGDSRDGVFIPAAMSRSRNDRINQWGVNLGHSGQNKQIKHKASVGYIANLADAKGMQGTPSEGFGGFGQSSVAEVLDHQVPGLALYGHLQLFDQIVFRGEHVQAVRHFDTKDMTFDGHGAKPVATHLEAAYLFELMDKSASVALGIDRTKDALALGIPEHRYLIGFNINPAKDVLLSFEFKHDENYGKNHTATGAGDPIGGMDVLGLVRNTLTGLLEYHF